MTRNKISLLSVWPASFFLLPPPWLRGCRPQTLPKRTKRKRGGGPHFLPPSPFPKADQGAQCAMQMFCLALSPLPPLKNKPPPNPNEASFTYGKHKAETKSPRGVTQRRNPTLQLMGGEKWPKCSSSFGWEGCFVWREWGSRAVVVFPAPYVT